MAGKKNLHPNSLANLKPFGPGSVGNPTGKRRRTFTKDHYANLIDKYSAMPVGTLRSILKDEATTAIDASVISQLLGAIDKGYAAESLLAYGIGKSADILQAEVKDTTETVDGLPVEVLLKAVNDRRG